MLARTTVVHVGDEPASLEVARRQCRRGLMLLLEEPAWKASGVDVSGVVLGKAPQHPATHKLYRTDDMSEYLRAALIPATNASTN